MAPPRTLICLAFGAQCRPMGGSGNRSRLATSLFGAAAWMCFTTPADAADAWRSRVSAKLLSIYDSSVGERIAPASDPSKRLGPDNQPVGVRFDTAGRVETDVYYDCSLTAPPAALSFAGLAPGASVKLASMCVVEGWAAPAVLSRIATVGGVTRLKVPSYASPIRPRAPTTDRIESPWPPAFPVGSAQTQAVSGTGIDGAGVSIMRADQFVAQTGSSGSGVTVGVQSVGVTNLRIIQGRRELPAVRVLYPTGTSSAPAGDEGTVLLEEAHAVSPGASLAFCGPRTFVEYTSCLGQLIAAGATILVDDLVFSEQDPMSSDTTATRAIGQILSQNPAVALFTAAGNDNGSYWEGQYAPVSLASLGLMPLSCPANGGTQVDNYVSAFDTGSSQLLTVKQSGTFPLTFAWADPVDQNVSNFDVYWFDSNSTTTGCFSTASATATLIAQTLSLNAGTYTLYLATPDASPAGKFLKLWVGGDGLTSLSAPTRGSVISPQAFAAGVLTIGAVNGSDGVGNGIESFSSRGPITVAFPSQTHIQAPVLVAPDGIYVDATGTYISALLFPDGNFYGTSAAVPNAGAVAALLRGAFPNLTVPQVVSALQSGAFQVGSGVPDGTFGYGRVDAMGALGILPAPTMSPLPDITVNASVSSSETAFEISGTGNLHFVVTSSNPALIPASIVAAGSAGITVNPSTCGSTTLSCTLTVTPVSGQGGTSHLTVSAVDGANRSAPATTQVTVTNPVGPTVVVASGSGPTGAGGGGGALEWWELVSMALLVGMRAMSGILGAGFPRRRLFNGNFRGHLAFMLTSLAITSTAACAGELPGRRDVPAWVFPLNPPTDAQPASYDRVKPLHVPSSRVALTEAQLNDLFAAPDWHPGSHSAMPEIVSRGHAPDVYACGYCHTHRHPERVRVKRSPAWPNGIPDANPALQTNR